MSAAKKVPPRPQGLRGLPTTPEANRRAAAILEVLGGLRSPSEAAEALGVSVPRYYALEVRAMRGLVTACDPTDRRRGKRLKRELSERDARVEALERENKRLGALVRAAQRTVGLSPPPDRTKSKKRVAGKRTRRPAARALKMAKLLNEATPAATGAEGRQEAHA